MDTTERFYKIDQMLRNRGVVSARDFLAVLEVSPATFKRDLQYLRDRLYAPNYLGPGKTRLPSHRPRRTAKVQERLRLAVEVYRSGQT